MSKPVTDEDLIAALERLASFIDTLDARIADLNSSVQSLTATIRDAAGEWRVQ